MFLNRSRHKALTRIHSVVLTSVRATENFQVRVQGDPLKPSSRVPCSISRVRSFARALRPVSAMTLTVTGMLWAVAGSSQTVYAPGGLFVHPTAFTPRKDQFSVYAAALTQDESPGFSENYYPLALTYVPVERLQVSGLFVYHHARDDAPHVHVGGFLKYQLAEDTPRRPAFAIGGAYVGNDHLESSAFAVASHAFMARGRIAAILHLGAKWGRTPDDRGGADDFGGFVGLQVPIAKEWDLVGETSTRFKFNQSSASSIGFMYHNRSGIGVSLALVNNGWSSRMKPFIGVGFPLGPLGKGR
jgi:hypothetical protein